MNLISRIKAGKSIFHNLAGSIQLIIIKLFSGIITLILTPFLLRNANPTTYGLFITIVSFATILELLDLGVSNGVRTRIAAAQALHDDTEIQILISSVFFLVVSLAVVVAIVGMFFTPLIQWQALIKIPHGYLGQFQKSITFGFVGLSIGLVGGMAVKLNLALSNIRSVTIWNTFSVIATSLSLFWLSSRRDPLEGLIFGQLIIPGIIGILNLAILFYRNPKLRPKAIPKVREIRSVLASGKLFLVLEATTLISFQIDSVIVGHYLEPRQVATLATSWKLFSAPLVIVSAAVVPLWTATARAHANNNRKWIKNSYIYSLLLTSAVALPYSVVIVFYGKFAVKFWTHNQIIPSSNLIYASAIWLFIACVTLPYAMILNGLHASRFLVVTAIFMTAFNVPASIILTRIMKDPAGPLIGNIFAQILCFFIPLFFWIRHRI